MKMLQAQVGKKVIWAGFDEDDELYTLVFEGPVIIRFPEYSPIENTQTFLESFLGHNLSQAKNLVELERLVAIEKMTGELNVRQEAAKVQVVAAPQDQPAPTPESEGISTGSGNDQADGAPPIDG